MMCKWNRNVIFFDKNGQNTDQTKSTMLDTDFQGVSYFLLENLARHNFPIEIPYGLKPSKSKHRNIEMVDKWWDGV